MLTRDQINRDHCVSDSDRAMRDEVAQAILDNMDRAWDKKFKGVEAKRQEWRKTNH